MSMRRLAIKRHQDKMRNKGLFTSDTKQILLSGSRWQLKEEIEEYLVESVSDHNYMRLIQLMEKLLSMSYCSLEESSWSSWTFSPVNTRFLPCSTAHRESLSALQMAEGRPPKPSSITLRDSGSGNITINGSS